MPVDYCQFFSGVGSPERSLGVPAPQPFFTGLTVRAGVLIKEEASTRSEDLADIAHDREFLRRAEVVQGEADPCHVDRRGPPVQRRDEVRLLERRRAI